VSENWSKISVFKGGLSLSVSGKFSRSRGRVLQTIFEWIDRTVNVFQLCRWQSSHKETL